MWCPENSPGFSGSGLIRSEWSSVPTASCASPGRRSTRSAKPRLGPQARCLAHASIPPLSTTAGTVVLDSARVRVERIVLEPGASTIRHSHPWSRPRCQRLRRNRRYRERQRTGWCWPRSGPSLRRPRRLVLAFLGIKLDQTRNAGSETVISGEASRVDVCVIHTDEELIISKNVSRVLADGTR